MIAARIRELRDAAGYTQAQLARKLGVTRSALNAWEQGLSTPTTRYIVDMAKLFHVSTDYILGLTMQKTIVLDEYSAEEVLIIHNLLKYFDAHRVD